MEETSTKIKSKDFWAGLLFAAIGLFFLGNALFLPLGSSSHMGPGYFPALTGGLLLLLGVAIAVRALLAGGIPVSRVHLRPMVFVILSVLVFALTVELIGLPVSIVALVVVAGLARVRPRMTEYLLLGAFLALCTTLLFVWALELPFKWWPL